VGLECLYSMVIMGTKLFSAVNLVKLSYIELNEVKASSHKVSSMKLGSILQIN
jgi:hypothetical protein